MPLGGTDSGLFRFPRVGEKVLVGTEEGRNYLMRYIPIYT
ncbi:MAG: phage baseplate assembly protein V [Spirochaetaceae bacterium]|nr:phage baseplate assembly protein V [Spirochaetaceae bacterium]